MAANLVKAGFDVVGYNRSPEKVKELVEKGGRGADDVASAVREADVVITMVPDSPGRRGRHRRRTTACSPTPARARSTST